MGHAIGTATDTREALAGIVGGEHVRDDPATLAGFARDHSDQLPIPPRFVARPEDEPQVQELVRWANATGTPLVPVSSGPPHFRGDTVPGAPGAVVVDLRRMSAIRRIDRRNKLTVIELGVTHAQLQPALAAEGLRVVTPLRPRAGKSVIAGLLEREPTLVPRYHYAFPEPLRNCGVVWGVGTGVTKAKVGDHVVCTWMVPCGECHTCREGLGNVCMGNFENFAAGVLLDGTSRYTDKDGKTVLHNSFVSGFSSHSVVPEDGVIPVRKDFPLEYAALMACCIPTGWGTVTNIAKGMPGDSVAVWGMGGVGLNILRAAKMRQANPVIAVDIMPEREQIAREFGATHFICNDGTDPVPIIKDLTGGGADVIFEAIGDPGAIVQAWWALATAGKLVVAGVMRHDDDAVLPLQLLPFHQKSILGGLYGSISTHNDIPKLVDLAMTGEMKLDKLVAGKFKLEDLNDIAERMTKRQLQGRWVCEWD